MADEVLGIHQSDVVIRGALIAGLADLRNSPWLLQFVFASLPKDSVTANEYGAQEVKRAIEWFTRTNIPVIWNISVNEPKFPCVSIALVSSQEVEQEGTLSDTHYKPFDDEDGAWPTLVGPLVLSDYDVARGILTFDANSLGGFILAPGMIVLTNQGAQYPILEMVDNNAVIIEPGLDVDLSNVNIKPKRPAYIVQVESSVFKETYAIGCHVDSEPVHLTYLHSIVTFILLAYRETLLESRSFERSTIMSTDFKRDDEALPEFLYSRYIQISGSVRQSWPKAITLKASSVQVELTVTNDVQDVVIDDDALGGAVATLGTLYYGIATQPGSVDAAFIRVLARDTAVRPTTLAFNAIGDGKYCWIAYPTNLGAATENNFIDAETGDVAGFDFVGTVVVDGTPCYVWRSNQANLGQLSIKVTR